MDYDHRIRRRDLVVVLTPPEALDPDLRAELDHSRDSGAKQASETSSEPEAIELPSPILIAAAALYVVMIGLLWLGFGGTIDSAASLGVATFVGAMFLAIPFALAKTAHLLPHDLRKGFRTLASRTVETATGSVSGGTALILVLTVPIVLMLGAGAIALVFHLLS